MEGPGADEPPAAPLTAFGRAWARLKQHPLARVGPGLITGVADDDPSGIATYSQAGAQFGLNLLWTMPLVFPLMAAIQSLCGRIGRVTGRGLAANIRAAFPRPVLIGVVAALLVANVLNIAADLAAMGEAAELVSGVNRHVMTSLFVVVTPLLQIFVPYHRYVRVLKWLTLSLLAYVAVLFTVHVPWGEVLARTVWPQLALTPAAAAVVVGVLGTTISPYLFFWQAAEEVEDLRARRNGRSLLADPAAAPAELRRIRWDTWSGMFYSDAVAYVIMLATAVTLHAGGITDINTAADAANALRPIAGDFAFALFTLGILGVGLIGVPVLAGAGAYALAEALDWPFGLERAVGDARGFYATIALSVLAALAIQYSPISPMKALVYSAILNGIVAVPLMVVIMLLVGKRSVMGPYVATRGLRVLGWTATVAMAVAVVLMLWPR